MVCAGCCQPLLGDGLSRRFLCKSVPRCLGPDPGGSSGACACFFPNVIGLPQVLPIGRLPASLRSRDFTAAGVSRSSPFLTFRPPGLLATQVSPTATAKPQGSRDFYVRAEPVWLPSQASDMLAVRIRQLTAEDFHLIRLAALSAAPEIAPAKPPKVVFQIWM